MQAREENILALMGLIGSDEEEVVAKLATKVAFTVADDAAARLLANDVSALLGRSFELANKDDCDVEVAFGIAFRTSAKWKMQIGLSRESITVSSAAAPSKVEADVPGLFRKIGACYAVGNVIARVVDGKRFGSLPDPFVIKFATFGVTADDCKRQIKLEDAVLVGAGGVGNGLMWAAAELNLEGHLTIADPKAISAGGLNRCLFFSEDDVGKYKAVVLAERTTSPSLIVDAFPHEFSRLVKERKRVRRVFTTPDSREVRRSVQNELPLEVLDASTTDASEVVVYSSRQPTEKACLACIYRHIPVEDHRRQHIAEGLGLDVEEVAKGLIDEKIAKKLSGLHANLDETSLVGKAFDTVYKDQCGKGVLKNPAGQQAVAPLAFISNLAGSLLALELVRFSLPSAKAGSAYMALSPWHVPSVHARRVPARATECDFCGSENGPATLRVVWPDVLGRQ